jgi:hypothetical protein
VAAEGNRLRWSAVSRPPEPAPWQGNPVPFRFQAEPPPAPARNPALIWVLRGLGLVAVAVISGTAWYYITGDSAPSGSARNTTSNQAQGEFVFTPYEGAHNPRRDTSCAEHSYDDVKKFFTTTPCEQLTRALYTTTLDGQTVYTSVAVVRMPSAADATRLREKVDADDTGNVTDLIRDGVVKITGLPRGLAGGGYKSAQHDRDLVIVESDFAPAAKRTEAQIESLKRVSTDAIRLGDQLSG